MEFAEGVEDWLGRDGECKETLVGGAAGGWGGHGSDGQEIPGWAEEAKCKDADAEVEVGADIAKEGLGALDEEGKAGRQ